MLENIMGYIINEDFCLGKLIKVYARLSELSKGKAQAGTDVCDPQE